MKTEKEKRLEKIMTSGQTVEWILARLREMTRTVREYNARLGEMKGGTADD